MVFIMCCSVFTESFLIFMDKKSRKNNGFFVYVFPFFYRCLSYYWFVLLVGTLILGYRLLKRMWQLSFFETHFSKCQTSIFYISIVLLAAFNIYKNQLESHDTMIISEFYDYHTKQDLIEFCHKNFNSFLMRLYMVSLDFHFLQLFIVTIIIRPGSSFEILVDLILLQDQITATIYKTWNSDKNEKERFETWLFDEMLAEQKGHS